MKPHHLYPGSAQEVLRYVSDIVYWREVLLWISKERCGWRLVEVAHEEDPNSANEKYQCHDNEANPVDHPGHQEPLFIFLHYEK